jgi:hypothetical protein
MQFFEDVNQGRRLKNAPGDRETQPVGLARAMIWILSQDHHLDPVEGRSLKRIENKTARRIYGEFCFLLHQEFLKCSEVGGLELVHQDRFPSFLDFGVDGSHREGSYQNYTNGCVGNFPVIQQMKFIFLVQTAAKWEDVSYTGDYLR